ncbi:MAG TPA: N-acetylneuraminate synthase family protein [Solirubrobacteraceae bacterium]|jgi:N-acetylneuraminate synthase
MAGLGETGRGKGTAIREGAASPGEAESYSTSFQLGTRRIAAEEPTYFIADIASNHDGSLERAKELIWRCREAGADAVKFQHFRADAIVSDYGFRELGGALGHQAAWSEPVFDVYRRYELNRDWTEELAATARAAQVDFLTTPYDHEAVQRVAALVPAFKIGSGDIDWLAFIRRVAREGKPLLLACGAASMQEVVRALDAALAENPRVALMQCNTNYTGSLENFRFINLRVLNAFAERWPGLPLGLSDHTPGHATTLGAVTLGARLIEKHFTDDNAREGPDHPFSMTPSAWAEMVQRTRELELALGDGVKRVEQNEREARIVQRRCVRLARDLAAGSTLGAEDLECLRPAEPGSLGPDRVEELVGATLVHAMLRGQALGDEDIVWPC